MDEKPSLGLSKTLPDYGFRSGGSRPGRRRGSTGGPSRWGQLEMQTADDDPVPFSLMTDAYHEAADRVRHHADRRPRRMKSSATISAARRCIPAPSRVWARAIARRSRTRSSSSAIGTGTRSFSSPRGSTTTSSIRTASRRRCRRMFSWTYPQVHSRARECGDAAAGLCNRI